MDAHQFKQEAEVVGMSEGGAAALAGGLVLAGAGIAGGIGALAWKQHRGWGFLIGLLAGGPVVVPILFGGALLIAGAVKQRQPASPHLLPQGVTP